MHNLNEIEIRILNDCHSINTKGLTLGPLVQERQRILELLFKNYCSNKYSCTKDEITSIINNCLSNDAKFKNGTTSNGKTKYHNHHKYFRDNFFAVNTLRNKIQHDGHVPTQVETELSEQHFIDCVKYYFEKCLELKKSDITTTDAIALKVLNELFPSPKESEVPVEREKFYVILLIDCSGSMQGPFNNLHGGDKIKGLQAVQKTMSLAQQKALDALRGSAGCLKRSMWVYQYVFNQESDVLNPPKLLSPFGTDEVKKIDETNYKPEGVTALYNTIEESLRVTYENYLKPAKEKSKRIDKVSIGVITDGEDNFIDGVFENDNKSLYDKKKSEKINSIRNLLKLLRGNGNASEYYLESSVLIGLTGEGFSEDRLKEIQKELGFEVAISIDSEDEKSLRQAFKTASTNALNI